MAYFAGDGISPPVRISPMPTNVHWALISRPCLDEEISRRLPSEQTSHY